jgi:hypothetical protein
MKASRGSADSATSAPRVIAVSETGDWTASAQIPTCAASNTSAQRVATTGGQPPPAAAGEQNAEQQRGEQPAQHGAHDVPRDVSQAQSDLHPVDAGPLGQADHVPPMTWGVVAGVDAEEDEPRERRPGGSLSPLRGVPAIE